GWNVYVAGVTSSAALPTTNPIQGSLRGGSDAFVARFGQGGLLFSTYLGGSRDESASLDSIGSVGGPGLAVGPGGAIHVVGTTYSDDFPVAHAVQSVRNPGCVKFCTHPDAFVVRIEPDPPAAHTLPITSPPAGQPNPAPSAATVRT